MSALNSIGLSGGLSPFWHEQMEVELLSLSDWMIDVAVTMEAGEPQWRATFIHG